MVRWCSRLTRLTLVCEVIRYRFVLVRQNLKKKKKNFGCRQSLRIGQNLEPRYFWSCAQGNVCLSATPPPPPLSLSLSLSFSLLPFRFDIKAVSFFIIVTKKKTDRHAFSHFIVPVSDEMGKRETFQSSKTWTIWRVRGWENCKTKQKWLSTISPTCQIVVFLSRVSSRRCWRDCLSCRGAPLRCLTLLQQAEQERNKKQHYWKSS